MGNETSRFVELACRAPAEAWIAVAELRYLWQFDPGARPEAEQVYLRDVLRELPPRHLHAVCLLSPATARFVEREVLGWPFYAAFLARLREAAVDPEPRRPLVDDAGPRLEPAYRHAVLAAMRLSPAESQAFIQTILDSERPADTVASPLIEVAALVGRQPEFQLVSRCPPAPPRRALALRARTDWMRIARGADSPTNGEVNASAAQSPG